MSRARDIARGFASVLGQAPAKPSDEEIRLACLDAAARSRLSNQGHDQVIAAAKAFETYVRKGDKS